MWRKLRGVNTFWGTLSPIADRPSTAGKTLQERKTEVILNVLLSLPFSVKPYSPANALDLQPGQAGRSSLRSGALSRVSASVSKSFLPQDNGRADLLWRPGLRPAGVTESVRRYWTSPKQAATKCDTHKQDIFRALTLLFMYPTFSFLLFFPLKKVSWK